MLLGKKSNVEKITNEFGEVQRGEDMPAQSTFDVCMQLRIDRLLKLTLGLQIRA